MAAAVTEARWLRRTAGLGLRARWGLKFGTTDRGVAAGGKGRRGWVIYFPPARHNLSRGFSREHAERAFAIEEEADRRVCGEKRTVRGSERAAGSKRRMEKGCSVAVADASRWRYQETDVNGGKAILILRVGPCASRLMKERESGLWEKIQYSNGKHKSTDYKKKRVMYQTRFIVVLCKTIK